MIVSPGRYVRRSRCGYCENSTGSQIFAFDAKSMTLAEYQQLIDRGFRRSGSFVYKPDLRSSCCPQYTIRLDVERFRASKEQRQTLNRFNRGLANDGDGGAAAKSKSKSKRKGKDNEFDLVATVKDASLENVLRVEIVPAEYSDEKFELYKAYQMSVHGDEEHKVTPNGFTMFLCTNPFQGSPGSRNGGAVHQLYYHRDKLIAIAVLDILPKCVSSVYFIWHPDYAKLGLGKVGALREIALARELDRPWYYMGYYIHSCQKMKYKLLYQPSFLLEPRFTEHDVESGSGDSVWNASSKYTDKLSDDTKYVSLIATPQAEIRDSSTDSLLDSGMPGILTAHQLSKLDLSQVGIRVPAAPMGMALDVVLDDIDHRFHSIVQKILTEMAAAVGPMILHSIIDLT